MGESKPLLVEIMDALYKRDNSPEVYVLNPFRTVQVWDRSGKVLATISFRYRHGKIEPRIEYD
jgi:hypothetical protein